MVVSLKEQINQLNQEKNKLQARLRFLENDNDKISTIATTVGQYLRKERGQIDSAKMSKLGISEVEVFMSLELTHGYTEEVDQGPEGPIKDKGRTHSSARADIQLHQNQGDGRRAQRGQNGEYEAADPVRLVSTE
jgi:hypothetical protein